MLNRHKVLQELATLDQRWYRDLAAPLSIARTLLSTIATDPHFAQRCKEYQGKWDSLPVWFDESLMNSFSTQAAQNYSIMGIDGSQIYPDRHQGTCCFLINIGWLYCHYKEVSSVIMDSKPFIYVPDAQDTILSNPDQEIVNCLRQDLELSVALEHVPVLSMNCILVDGSLSNWNTKDPERQQYFSQRYKAHVNQLYNLAIINAGYISLPQHQDIVTLLKLALCDFNTDNSIHQSLDCLTDADVVSLFLKPFERTILFQSTHWLTVSYPDYLKPCFFYLHADQEIVRIEVPAWIAHNKSIVERLTSYIIDQIHKGGGYPVVLSEAHEQAVIHTADREFFYHALSSKNHHLKNKILSQKSIKKKFIGI